MNLPVGCWVVNCVFAGVLVQYLFCYRLRVGRSFRNGQIVPNIVGGTTGMVNEAVKLVIRSSSK